MSLDAFAAFTLASLVVLAIPGPTILLVCSYAINVGRRSAAAMAVGVALGDLAAMTASFLGLGALLLSSAELFTLLRWVGAAYLVWLGWRLFWSDPTSDAGAAVHAATPLKMGFHAFAVTATNPKSILFFVAFTPQFIDPTTPLPPQMAIMVATFVTLATVNALAYALLAERAGRRLSTPRARRRLNQLSGGALMGLGVVAALSRRAG